ncbi:membrane-bound transcription factor site-2 protease homolog isoform X2 [Jatropha curcas]|uniref:membrane-bound transcription factor site-2 protease homolog isoform X2 n=1 Tax=Jatropha curcas TaxID=180498 RepID=UPI0005FAF5C9|nr:membrane-bound transcription factor site-2 protease homolog isoform X2 [Jatropha curcas]
MEGRRVRRFGRGQTNTLLPLQTSETRTRRLSNTISCLYCDYKFSVLNGPLFRFGRKHARFFKIWFSIGVGFTLTALLVVTMILTWELGNALHIFRGKAKLDDGFSSLLFGFSPRVYGLRLSVADAAYLLFSTLISVSVHEFGHAISAASEGIPTEYIAIFVAVLFPGALVAFNYELLQILECFAALRVYCAGIWHNAVCCAACGLLLSLLPLILCPFFIHGESPMVLYVPSSSPLSGYLSPGDVIMSLDGKRIRNEREWMEMAALVHEQAFQSSNHSETSKVLSTVHSRKGYCVLNSLIEESKKINLDESCLSPVQLPGLIWVEITYSSSYSPECLQPGGNFSSHAETADFMEKNCGGTFVFVGDVFFMAHSIQLTAYRPRWAFTSSAYLPKVLEKGLIWTFQVSLTLALLNSLPVYFLDGESILEAALCHFTLLDRRNRSKVLQACLTVGTIICVLAFMRIFFNFL